MAIEKRDLVSEADKAIAQATAIEAEGKVDSTGVLFGLNLCSEH